MIIGEDRKTKYFSRLGLISDDQYHSDILLSLTMGFSPVFTSTWDSSLLDGMLHQLRAGQGDLPNVSMAEEDSNVGEETINVSDTEVEKTIDVSDTDIENTIEVSDSGNTIDFEVGYQIFEGTINITDEDTIENVTEMEYSNNSDEDETSGSDNISSCKYFSGCPVHNHHTDSESMCPDDPPCLCLSEI